MSTFVISDLHFNHANILRYDNRQFACIGQHDETIIANWNSVVQPDDHVYCLGDICFEADVGVQMVQRLNGLIHLVDGNHDSKALEDEDYRSLFVWVKGYHELKYNKHLFIFCHYPLLEWNQGHRGTIHCHGHVHGSLMRKHPWYYEFRVFDLSVHLWDYTPVNLDRIIRLADSRSDFKHH